MHPITRRGLVCVFILAALFCASPAGAVTYANDLIFKSDGSLFDGNGWNLSANCFIGTFINHTAPGNVTFTIKAEGQGASGVLPVMHLHVADFNTSWSVADHGGAHTGYIDYAATYNLPSGTFWVRVEFTNAAAGRNLYVKSLDVSGASVSILNSATRENCLAAADTYILNCRRGAATVTLNASEGGTVPATTSVRAKLKRHAFNFGNFQGGYSLSDPTFHFESATPPIGGIDDKVQKFIESHYNMVVTAVVSKWQFCEPVRDTMDMSGVDAVYNYCEARGLRSTYHSLFWIINNPPWADDLYNRAIAGDLAAKTDLRQEMSEWIQATVAARANRYVEVGVISEDYHYHYIDSLFGFDGVAGIYNEVAAAAAGRAKTQINEWGAISGEYLGLPYSNWYRDYIQSILNVGGQIDEIGLQCHTSTATYAGSFGPVHAFRNLQMLSGFERPIAVNEFSVVNDNNNQAAAPGVLTDTMRFIFGNDKAVTFIMDGFWRSEMWVEPTADHGACALVDANWNLTPSGTAFEQLMAQWSTDVTTAADSNGRISFTGYYGDYDITVNGITYPLTITKGASSYSMTVCRSPATVSGKVMADLPGTPPVVGATVKASGTSYSCYTDSNGNYSITLPPGYYTLRAGGTGFSTGNIGLDLNPGETPGQDFTLSPSGTSLMVQARLGGAGWKGALTGIVTGVFPDYDSFAIEAPDLSAGMTIKPLSGHSVAVGDEVIVGGTARSDGALQASTFLKTGATKNIRPLGMTNANMKGSVDRTGINNCDMLVGAWGNVVDTPSMFPDGSTRFRLSDSSKDVPQVLFEDDFNSGKKPQWYDRAGTSYAQNGKLVFSCPSNGYNFSIVNGVNAADVVASADGQSTTLVGIIVRYSNSSNFVVCIYNPMTGANDGVLYFHEVIYGAWSPWINTLSNVVLSGNARLTVTAEGSQITLTATDGVHTYSTGFAPRSNLGPGTVGIFHQGPDLYLDNFQVISPYGPSVAGPAYVQVIVPPSVTGADSVAPGQCASAIGIAGLGANSDGTPVRSVMIRNASDLVNQSKGTPVFEDDFTGGRKARWVDDWIPMYAENGKMVADCLADTHNRTVVSGLSLTNPQVGVDALSNSVFAVLVRFQNGTNFVLAGFAGASIFFQEIVNNVGWATKLGEVAAPSLGPNVRMTVTAQGALITASITDGARNYSTSFTPQHLLGPGLVGLFHNITAGTTPQQFDNFVVYQP